MTKYPQSTFLLNVQLIRAKSSVQAKIIQVKTSGSTLEESVEIHKVSRVASAVVRVKLLDPMVIVLTIVSTVRTAIREAAEIRSVVAHAAGLVGACVVVVKGKPV